MNQVIFSDACEHKMLQSHERDQLCGTTHWFLGNDGENAAICNSVIVVMSSMYVVGVDHTVSSCGKPRRKAHAALCERGKGVRIQRNAHDVHSNYKGFKGLFRSLIRG
jgi:hypothetical protein